MTLPTSQVYVAQDFVNGTSSLQLRGGWGRTVLDNEFYNGTQCASPVSTPASFTFLGPMQEMRLFGFCDLAVTFQVSIGLGNNAPYNTSGPVPNTHSQVYQSPMLSIVDGTNITFTNAPEDCCFDLIVAALYPSVSISGQTLLVDDTYEKIQYSGSWKANTNESFGTEFPEVPLMNTTHQTSTVGDTMRFAFSGTNAVVYGGKLNSQVGNFSISYSIDEGSKTTRTFTSDGSGETFAPNLQLVDTGPLTSGDHILTLNLTTCFNQALIVDYITYTPNFGTLGEMPNLTIPPDSSSQTSTPPASTNTSPSSTTSSSTTPIGAIVGGVVGGLAVILISCLVIFWCIRRRRKMRSPEYSHPEQPLQVEVHAGYPIDPYTLQSASVSSAPVTASKSDRIWHSPPVSEARIRGADSDTLTRREDDSILSSPTVSTTGPEAPTQADNVSPAELARRVNDLSQQFNRLQSFVIPPAYESS